MSRPKEDDQADALERELADEDKDLLDKIADGLSRRRLAAAALFFLESMKPMNFLASQAMLFFRPVIQAVSQGNPVTWDRLQKLLERRGAIELLLRRLEAKS
jgi:hypothetical protein